MLRQAKPRTLPLSFQAFCVRRFGGYGLVWNPTQTNSGLLVGRNYKTSSIAAHSSSLVAYPNDALALSAYCPSGCLPAAKLAIVLGPRPNFAFDTLAFTRTSHVLELSPVI